MDDHTPPILQSMKSAMKCGIFTNDSGQILIVHNQEITAPIDWVEYDQTDNILTLVFENGQMQDLGIKLNPTMQSQLTQCQQITLALLKDKKVVSKQTATLIIKDIY